MSAHEALQIRSRRSVRAVQQGSRSPLRAAMEARSVGLGGARSGTGALTSAPHTGGAP